MRVLFILVPLLVAAVFVAGFFIGKHSSTDQKRVRDLQEQNEVLLRSESDKLKSLREELDGYSEMTDQVVRHLSLPQSDFTLQDRASQALEIISSTRPRRTN